MIKREKWARQMQNWINWLNADEIEGNMQSKNKLKFI